MVSFKALPCLLVVDNWRTQNLVVLNQDRPISLERCVAMVVTLTSEFTLESNPKNPKFLNMPESDYESP